MYEGPVDKEGNSLEGKSELLVAKHRNGPTGSIDLHFHKQYTRFASTTDREGVDA
jgi:replicative DNA helicase